MLQFLREMLASDTTFTLKVYDLNGFVAAEGGLVNVDELGLTIDDPTRGWVLFPWRSVRQLKYEEG